MILGGMAIQAVLLPLLFFGLLYVVEESHKAGFIDGARKYSRFLAEHMEATITEESFEGRLVTDIRKNYPELARKYHLSEVDAKRQNILRLLDSAVLGSDSVFAELNAQGEHIASSLSTVSNTDFIEDFSFGGNGDHIYFISIPLAFHGADFSLRMGFDETPVQEQIELARNRLLVILGGYLLVSMLALAIISTLVIKPLKRLQNVSRKIASGEYGQKLQVDSQLSEINELAADLESMRFELVSVNKSLQHEVILRKTVEDRRKALEGKLRQAQKMETVGILVGGISHEFNNILQPIFLYTEQAQHDLEAQHRVQKHLARIYKSATRAKHLVGQILTFSRQSSGQGFKVEDMTAVVEEALELLRALIPSSIELNYELNAAGCKVWAEYDQLLQVIMNLGSNAFLAIDKPHGAITLKLNYFTADAKFVNEHPLLKKGRYVCLSIEDNGRGIDAAYIDRIFEPFYTTRAVGKGTGLGLSVVHGIVSSHQGDISVQSEPGNGAVFKIYLPVYSGDNND